MASPLQSGGTSGAEYLLRPCLPLRLVASFQLPPPPFKKNFFLLLVVFHVSLYSSPFSICALRFSLSIRLPFFRVCTKIFPLFAPRSFRKAPPTSSSFAPFFSPFLCRSTCLAHVLPRVCLVFGFFVLFFRFLIVLQEMKIYSLLTMKNEKRRNPSRFSFTFAVEQFNLKTKQSFILKHTM